MKKSELKKVIREEFKKLNENVSTYDMKDAYSFDKIGYVAGDAILDAVRESDGDDKGAEEVFRSKHTRWFYDTVGDKIVDFVKGLFKDYIDKDSNGIKSDLAKWNSKN